MTCLTIDRRPRWWLRALAACGLGLAAMHSSHPSHAQEDAGQALTDAAQPADTDNGVPPSMLPTNDTWTGDLDGMRQRKQIRILVPYSKTFYFIDKGGKQYGATYEVGRAFEDWLNKQDKAKTLKTSVVFVPVPRDRLLSGLVDGTGDIAAGNITITDARAKLVQFSDIHIDTTSDTNDHLHKVVELVNQQSPDAIAITGDFVTHTSAAGIADALVEPLRLLKAKDAVVGILGNHDHWTDPAGVRLVMERSGIADVSNTLSTVQRGAAVLHLAGVDDYWERKDRLDDVLAQDRRDPPEHAMRQFRRQVGAVQQRLLIARSKREREQLGLVAHFGERDRAGGDQEGLEHWSPYSAACSAASVFARVA